MAYWTWAKDQVGSFVEKSAGNVFEYSLNDRSEGIYLLLMCVCDFVSRVCEEMTQQKRFDEQ